MPDWLTLIIVAPFVGSFLAVLALRLPEGEDVVARRSHCPKCGHVLSARELIPLVSWAIQGGRCTHCRRAIGLFYPTMELAAVAVVAWAALTMDGSVLWVTVLLGWSLLALAAMDIKSLTLADLLTLPLIAGGVGAIAVFNPAEVWSHAAAAAAGYALITLVGVAYRWARDREGLGAGDAKLMAAVGAWVGFDGLGTALLYATIAGLAFATLMRISGTKVEATTAIPIGAGIALGLWLVWLYGPLSFGA